MSLTNKTYRILIHLLTTILIFSILINGWTFYDQNNFWKYSPTIKQENYKGTKITFKAYNVNKTEYYKILDEININITKTGIKEIVIQNKYFTNICGFAYFEEPTIVINNNKAKHCGYRNLQTIISHEICHEIDYKKLHICTKSNRNCQEDLADTCSYNLQSYYNRIK